MTPEQFCYWLQGRAELDPSAPTAEQWQSIREHLATVFQKVTPPVRIPGQLVKEGPLDHIRPQTPAPSLPISPYGPYEVKCQSGAQTYC